MNKELPLYVVKKSSLSNLYLIQILEVQWILPVRAPQEE